MRCLGIDYGRVWIGVAFSEGFQANSLFQVHRNEALLRIGDVVQKQEIDKIVIGISDGFLKKDILEFGEKLTNAYAVQVVYFDETLTSHQAQGLVRQSGGRNKKKTTKEHQVAAALILEQYLDTQRL